MDHTLIKGVAGIDAKRVELADGDCRVGCWLMEKRCSSDADLWIASMTNLSMFPEEGQANAFQLSVYPVKADENEWAASRGRPAWSVASNVASSFRIHVANVGVYAASKLLEEAVLLVCAGTLKLSSLDAREWGAYIGTRTRHILSLGIACKTCRKYALPSECRNEQSKKRLTNEGVCQACQDVHDAASEDS